MASKNPTRILIILGLAGLLTAITTWCVGFFYWHLTLSGAIRKLHSQITELRPKQGEFPSEDLQHLDQFDHAMSRAVPILLRETDRALSAHDKVTASILIHYLSMAVAHADYHGEFEMQASPHIKLRSSKESLEELRLGHRINREWWESNKGNYPPLWMWWRGRRK